MCASLDCLNNDVLVCEWRKVGQRRQGEEGDLSCVTQLHHTGFSLPLNGNGTFVIHPLFWGTVFAP